MDPTNDLVFQALFGDPQNKRYLLSLLNAVLGLSGDKRLKDIWVKNNWALKKKHLREKSGRLDIVAITADGTLIDIEMQLKDEHNMDRRTLFYGSKLFLSTIRAGEDYSTLKKTITINFVNFRFLPTERFHSTFHLYEDREKNVMLTDVLEIHFVELPKFREMEPNLFDPLHRWLMFMDKDISEKQLEVLMAMDTTIRSAEDELSRLKMYLESRSEADYLESAELEWNSSMNSARREATKTVARNMLREGAKISFICKVTGLSEEQVGALKQSD